MSLSLLFWGFVIGLGVYLVGFWSGVGYAGKRQWPNRMQFRNCEACQKTFYGARHERKEIFPFCNKCLSAPADRKTVN